MVKYRDFSKFTSTPSSLYWSCTHYYILHQLSTHLFFIAHHIYHKINFKVTHQNYFGLWLQFFTC